MAQSGASSLRSEDARVLEYLRQRLITLVDGINALGSAGTPTDSLAILTRHVEAIAEHLCAHSLPPQGQPLHAQAQAHALATTTTTTATLSRLLVHPLPTFPGRAQAHVVPQLLAKKLAPDVAAWAEDGRRAWDALGLLEPTGPKAQGEGVSVEEEEEEKRQGAQGGEKDTRMLVGAGRPDLTGQQERGDKDAQRSEDQSGIGIGTGTGKPEAREDLDAIWTWAGDCLHAKVGDYMVRGDAYTAAERRAGPVEMVNTGLQRAWFEEEEEEDEDEDDDDDDDDADENVQNDPAPNASADEQRRSGGDDDDDDDAAMEGLAVTSVSTAQDGHVTMQLGEIKPQHRPPSPVHEQGRSFEAILHFATTGQVMN